MKAPPSKALSSSAAARENGRLRRRLAEADQTLRAMRSGEVDTVVLAGRHGPQVFTLQGAEHAYRLLIESMNEGALTLTADAVILYANQCFAKMLKCPLEQVIGSSFRRFLGAADRATLRPLLRRANPSGSKIQALLTAGDGSRLPAQISLRRLAKNGVSRATIGMVLTDMTQARHSEERLRALTHRVVQVQEAERGRVALELHDHITQLLCAVLFRSQALAGKLSARDGPLKKEAIKLRVMLGEAADAVERISRNLRPGVLEQMGLVAAVRAANTEFSVRTGVPVTLACIELATPLPADTELALYRILQEALRNVEQHARAGQVAVCLRQQAGVVQLAIKDDGVGFVPDQPAMGTKKKSGLGLLGMRERATYVGGALEIKSGRRRGTEIRVSVSLPAG